MTVTRRSFNAAMNTSGTSASSITIGVPTDVAEGELMIAITCQPTGTPTGTGPDGFELIGSFTSSTLQQSNLYRRFATASEPADYTWTFPQSGACGVALITFVGAHDILQWDAHVETATSTPASRRIEAARDAVAYTVCCWRDGASSTFTTNQGSEEFDIVAANTDLTIYRGITAALYGPGVAGVDDIVNTGDALPGTTFTSSGGALDHAITWALLIDNKAPDTEPWPSTNGDFAVDLKLDDVQVDSVGGITTEFKGDVTGQVAAFFESGENAPNEVTENLADGLVTTKWLDFADASFVTYDFGPGNAKTIKRYRLTSANDSPERDPMDWTLEGSNNNVDFTVLDTRQNIAFANRYETQEFNVTTPGSYRYYKLNISSNRGPTTATSTQLAEFRLSTHSVWEDVTTYVQEEQKIRITRGFQGSSGRHDFSRAYCTFKNTDGRFSIRNQDGAYFGSLQRNTQMRISKAYGTKTLQLQGDVQLEGTNMAGDGARTVLTSALQITGDIDVRIDLHPESWRDEQMLSGISTQSADPLNPVNSWAFYLDDDGLLHFTWYDGATTRDISSTTAVPNANRQAVRATLDVDDGASGNVVTFYYADTIAGPWTRLGTPVTSTGTTGIEYTGGALCVGHVGSKDQRGIHGRVYHFELYTGIAGTLVADVDFTTLDNGAHSFEDGYDGDTATGAGTSSTPDYLVASDADAADISIGDTFRLFDSGGNLKEPVVFTVTGKSSAFGFTNIEFTPDAQAVTVTGDQIRTGLFNRWITVNNAVVSNRHYRFHGEVAEWPLYWDRTGNWVEVSATGAGVQKRLERGSADDSAMYRFHTKGIIPDPGAFERFAEPKAYWPMEDLKDAIRVASGLPGKPHMEIYGTPEFESYSDFQGSKALPKLANSKFGGRVTGNAKGYADIRFLFYSPSEITPNANILTIYSSGSIRKWEVDYQTTDTWRIRGYSEDAIDTGTPTVSAFGLMTTIGEHMSVRLVLDETTSGGIAVTLDAADPYGTDLGGTTVTFSSQTLGRVYRLNINDDDTVKLNEVYVGHLALYDSADAPDFKNPLNSWLYETAGDRVKRICDEEEIEFRYVGAKAQTALMGHQDTGAPFGLMTTGAVSDDGYLIDPLDAFGIEYKTSRSLYNQAAHLTLSYASGDLSGELEPTSDDSYIVNDFTANRGGAGGARYRLDEGPLSVNPPPGGVGEYTASQSYSFAHEGQCVQMASWQVRKGTLDEERFPKLELALENLRIAADTAQIEAILTLDVGKRVDVTDTPDFLPSEDIRQIVIGYEEWFDNFQHSFKLNCIPERIFEIAEYDAGDSFDESGSFLYTDINSTDTTITTATLENIATVAASSVLGNPIGQPWTEEPESYPFLLKIDGEVMKAVAPGSGVNSNSGFDTDVTGWISNDSLAHSTAVVHPHPLALGSALVTPDGVGAFTNIQASTSNGIAVAEQNDYTASGWIYSPDGYSAASIFINWRDSGGSLVSTTTGTSTALVAGEWTYLEVTGTAPATAVTGHPGMQETGTPAATDEFYVWNLKIQEARPDYDTSWSGDSFNRADSTTSLGDTDGAGTIQTWNQRSGTWGINSNRAYISAAATSIATIGGSANVDEVSMEVPVWASGDAALVFRFTDTNNYIRWGGTVGGNATLVIVSGGVATATYEADRQGGSFTLAAGDKLSARYIGSVIEVFHNDILALCISDATNQTGTQVGMYLTTTAPRIDNFYVKVFAALQDIQVERGYNAAAAAHKANAQVSLYQSPYRGL